MKKRKAEIEARERLLEYLSNHWANRYAVIEPLD
jgi:hypothetical protein